MPQFNQKVSGGNSSDIFPLNFDFPIETTGSSTPVEITPMIVGVTPSGDRIALARIDKEARVFKTSRGATIIADQYGRRPKDGARVLQNKGGGQLAALNERLTRFGVAALESLNDATPKALIEDAVAAAKLRDAPLTWGAVGYMLAPLLLLREEREALRVWAEANFASQRLKDATPVLRFSAPLPK